MSLPDDLAAALAAAEPALWGQPLRWYPSVPSTNDVAARAAEAGAVEGTIIVADAQTAGRGRHGRTWVSPASSGLYVSILLRPAPDVTGLLTIAAGVALADGIEAASGLSPVLKWPNDLYAGGRKLAGVLAEGGTSVAGSHVVLGFGINVLPAAYPPEVAYRATSLETELGRSVERGALLLGCLRALADRYRELCAGGRAAVLEAWTRRAAPMLYRRVEWDGDAGVERGIAEGIDQTGALLVRTSAGVVRVISGEVRWT